MIAILDTYAKSYEEAPDKNTWFDGVKAICEGLGFCPEVKEYKKNPDGSKYTKDQVMDEMFEAVRKSADYLKKAKFVK